MTMANPDGLNLSPQQAEQSPEDSARSYLASRRASLETGETKQDVAPTEAGKDEAGKVDGTVEKPKEEPEQKGQETPEQIAEKLQRISSQHAALTRRERSVVAKERTLAEREKAIADRESARASDLDDLAQLDTIDFVSALATRRKVEPTVIWTEIAEALKNGGRRPEGARALSRIERLEAERKAEIEERKRAEEEQQQQQQRAEAERIDGEIAKASADAINEREYPNLHHIGGHRVGREVLAVLADYIEANKDNPSAWVPTTVEEAKSQIPTVLKYLEAQEVKRLGALAKKPALEAERDPSATRDERQPAELTNADASAVPASRDLDDPEENFHAAVRELQSRRKRKTA